MERARRITVTIPEKLLREATKATQKGITDTLVEGLTRVVRNARAYQRAMAMQGKVRLQVDLDELRGRGRR